MPRFAVLLLPAMLVAAVVEFPADTIIHDVRVLGAKGDGTTDDTAAFKEALAKDTDAMRIIYVPNGTYLVSDTLGWPRRRTLIGQSRDRVIIRLKDGAEGFGDPAKPKPVLHATIRGANYGKDSWANAAFDNNIRNFTVHTGKGNKGAVGIRYTTHNYGLMEDVTVRDGDGSGAIGIDMTQTEFGPGLLRFVTVEGFASGIETPNNVSHGTFDHITLRGQRTVGFVNRMPVSIRKLRSENRVPAIRHGPGGQLVLIDSELTGGAPDAVAIEAKGSYHLRAIKTSGYQAALKDVDVVVPGAQITDHISGATSLLAGSPKTGLGLPVEDPPEIFEEPLSAWTILAPSGGPDRMAVQAALDSGAKTIFFRKGTYQIDDTVVIPITVRRLIGDVGASFKGSKDNFGIGDLQKPSEKGMGGGKPFLRVSGSTSDALTIEHLNVSAWPHRVHIVEIASPRPVYIRHDVCGHPGGELSTAAAATGGKLFLLEAHPDLRINGDYRVFAWQYNPENNPFNAKSPTMKHRTYIINDGGKVWILGYKTESPAIHAITRGGGQTEIIGGFFRDHFGAKDYGSEVPYFIVEGGSLSANYLQYAWQQGKARALQLIAKDASGERKLEIAPGTIGLSLLRADVGKN